MSTANRVARRYLAKVAREFRTPEALKKYLEEHPKADPKRHTVKEKGKKKEYDAETKSKDEAEALSPLKGLSKGERKRVLEQALENLDDEEKGRAPKKLKDVSKEKGFEDLKDLSLSEQQKVIQKALKNLRTAAKVSESPEDFHKKILKGLGFRRPHKQILGKELIWKDSASQVSVYIKEDSKGIYGDMRPKQPFTKTKYYDAWELATAIYDNLESQRRWVDDHFLG